MSLVLDGSTDALYADTGISWNSYPLTIALWAKPANNTQDRTMAAFARADDLNFIWCDQNVAALRMFNRYASTDANPSIAAAVAASVWQPFIFVAKDNNEKWVWDGGTQSVVNTTDNGAMPSFTRLAIGCASRNAGPVERFFEGRLGHVAIFNVAADQAFADAWAAGAPANTLSGCTNWFKLESSSADSVGAWSLGDIGTPTYDAADNPPIVYPGGIPGGGRRRTKYFLVRR